MTAPVIALPTPEPPSDIEAERTILASVLDGQLAAVLESGLRPEHFYAEAHRRIFEAVVGLDADGQEVTASALRTWLDERGRLHQVGGAVTLGELLFVPTELGAPLRQTIDRVRSLARSRVAIASLTSAAAQLRADPRRLDAVLSSTRETVEALSGDTTGGLANVSFEELTSPLPPIEWLVQGINFAPGPPVLIAGSGFSGKTIFAQSLALAVIYGDRAFGAFPCGQGRVLHLDWEQGKRLTIERYQRLAAAHGYALADLAPYLAIGCYPTFRLDDADARAVLTRECRGVKLCIIDSYRAACPRTDENASVARVPLDMLAAVSDATGTVFLVIHHSRKPSAEDADGRQLIRGSTALFDASNNVITMNGTKGEPVKVEQWKERYRGTLCESFYLEIQDVEIDNNPRAGLRMVYMSEEQHRAVYGDKNSKQGKFVALKNAVIYVCEGERLTSKNAIAARVGGRKTDALQAIAELESEGRLAFVGGQFRVQK